MSVERSFDQSFGGEEYLALLMHAAEDDSEPYCLLIQAVQGTQDHCYRRVGIAWIGGHSVDIAWFKSWKVETLVII
jgi:hypothetical protein